MRKWILKGTTLKTPFYIALFRMKLRSHCTFFLGRISAMPEIRTDLFLAISWRHGVDVSDDVTTTKAIRRVNDKMF